MFKILKSLGITSTLDILFMATAILAALKVVGWVTWSWWIVVAPMLTLPLLIIFLGGVLAHNQLGGKLGNDKQDSQLVEIEEQE